VIAICRSGINLTQKAICRLEEERIAWCICWQRDIIPNPPSCCRTSGFDWLQSRSHALQINPSCQSQLQAKGRCGNGRWWHQWFREHWHSRCSAIAWVMVTDIAWDVAKMTIISSWYSCLPKSFSRFQIDLSNGSWLISFFGLLSTSTNRNFRLAAAATVYHTLIGLSTRPRWLQEAAMAFIRFRVVLNSYG